MNRPPLRPADLHGPTDPDESDLRGAPRVFVHRRCGTQTHLAAAGVRRYLADPFRLMGGGGVVWCAGCQKQVPAADCTWVETGGDVRDYYRALIAEALAENPRGWWARFLAVYSVAGLAFTGVVTLAIWQGTRDSQLAKVVAAGAGVFAVLFVAGGFAYRFVQYRGYLAAYRRNNGCPGE